MQRLIGRLWVWLLCCGLLMALAVHPRSVPAAASTFVYVAPLPSARLVSPATTLVVRTQQFLQIDDYFFAVSGSASGVHSGTLTLAADQQTLIFTPDQPFTPGETVLVYVAPALNSRSAVGMPTASWQFEIAPAPSEIPFSPELYAPFMQENAPSAVSHSSTSTQPYRTAPATLPQINLTVPANGAAPGYVWTANFKWGDRAGTRAFLLMLDDQGQPIYYQQMPPSVIALDFRKVAADRFVYHNTKNQRYYMYDQQYRLVDVYAAGNGYSIDSHEFLLLPNGHALFMIYDAQPVDMSQIVAGGDPNAMVIGLIIQEMDPAHNVVFEWRSWDHIPITDSYVNLTRDVVDYIHGNSIEVDHDGNLLVSNRHTHDVIKINRQTGAVMWRLGGKQNDFAFNTGTQPFHAQHDARRLENGNLLLFNNWTTFPYSVETSYSTAQEFALDEEQLTATLIQEFRKSPDRLAAALGSAQRLENGNTGIGWGSARPTFYSEFRPDGTIAHELAFAHSSNEVSYRTKRYTWQAQPFWPPALVVERNATTLDLFMSWNGATEVASYAIYASPNLTTAFTPRDIVARNGFETRFTITDVPADLCLLQIEARDAAGTALARSQRVPVTGSACTYQQIMLPLLTR